MRIISLNINNFGGNNKKTKFNYNNIQYKWEQFLSENKCENQYKKIFEIVKDFDVIVFQEYDYNSIQGKKLETCLKNIGYTPNWMSNFNNLKHPSITIIFAKEENNDKQSIIHYGSQYHSKSILFETNNLIVLGTHRPYNCTFWDELIKFYDKQLKRDKQVVLIGDMNLNIKILESKILYENLLEKGAIDKGKIEDKPTHYEYDKPRRVDYAFVSENLSKKCVLHTTPCVIDENKIESIIERNISDHEAIILEIF